MTKWLKGSQWTPEQDDQRQQDTEMECLNCSAIMSEGQKTCTFCGTGSKEPNHKFRLKERSTASKQEEHKEKARRKNELKYNNEGL